MNKNFEYLQGIYQGIKFSIKVVGRLKKGKAIIFFLTKVLKELEEINYEHKELILKFLHHKLNKEIL